MANLSELVASGRQQHLAGNLQQAELIYRQILQQDARHAEAIYLLGMLAYQVGKYEMAIEHFNQAIAIESANFAFFNSLGLACQALGRLDEAMVYYRRSIELNPGNANAYNNMGSVLQAIGHLEEAMEAYKQAIYYRPDMAEAHNNLAGVYQARKQHGEALASYTTALQLRPHVAEIHNNLGLVYQDTGEYDRSIACFQEAARLKPTFYECFNNLGCALQGQMRLDEAEVALRQAIQLKPDYMEAYYNLGNVLHLKGELGAAADCFRQAIAIYPAHAESYYNLGNVLHQSADFDEAVTAYQKALEIRPDFIEVCNNLGNTFKIQARFDEAVASYSRALDYNPHYPEAHLNRAIMKLLQGNYREGWEEYEWRLKYGKEYRLLSQLTQPQWDGSPLEGKRIQVFAEQGIGDTLQFLRYLPLIKERGGHIVFDCYGDLLRLLEGCPYIDELIPRVPDQVSSVPFDTFIYLMSLPHLFHTTLETIPSSENLINLDNGLVKTWQKRIGKDIGLKVGISWTTRPDNPTSQYRSCPLSSFMPLADIPGVTLYSLHKRRRNAAPADIPEGLELVNFEEEIQDFADTAAIIANMDLVISVDTAIVHLAGLLQKPFWVLLPHVCDWRWLASGQDSPWYPTGRLFRQTQLRDWDSVFELVASQLRTLVEKPKARKKKPT